jgi:ABC-type uncharacterized transport system involved in gliding motility auxiliary subunit
VEGLTVKRLVGLLGWLGVALVVVALGLRVMRPEMQPTYRALAIAGLVVTGLYALSQWRDIARSFSGRNVRYGSMAAGSIALVLAILVGVNWISTRQNKRWDVTEGGQFSLSDQTKQILRSLTKPLDVKVFYRSDSGDLDRFRDQFAEYEYTSSNVKLEYIDPDKEPMKAKSLDVQAYGTVVLQYEGKTERTTSTDEQGLANALKRLIEGKAKKVYFAEGHGERDTTNSDPQGFSFYSDALKSENFDVGKIVLAQDPKVPDDATIVVIAGPRSDYFPAEIDALKAFLGKGGKLLLLLDPPEPKKTVEYPNLVALAKDWNINIGTNIVVDAQSMQSAAFPLVATYPRHQITDNFDRIMTTYRFVRSVEPIEGGTNGRYAQKLLETSPRSWAEADIKGLFETGKPSMDVDKGDKQGPISIGAAVNVSAPDAPAPATPPDPAAPPAPKPETRVVVIGDSDFLSNVQGGIGFEGNRDLGLNIANWLAQQENLIAIRPKAPSDRRITLTPDQGTAIQWLTLLVVPGLLFLTAFRVFWKRR